MGIQSTERAISLAIFGIVVPLLLALLVVLRASLAMTEVCASVTLWLIVALYGPLERNSLTWW